ncbi:MAG: translation initiation factor IF-2 [Planctomycetes bacterium]|nr:translation initiation factor IF-2 [Planctomycetota bacterium]
MIKNEPDSVLSSDQRRVLIQDNIKRNLDMANRVKGAKERDKKGGRKTGFRSIDNRSKAGEENRGRGPGGPPGPGGPGGGPGGPRRGGGRKGHAGPNKKDQEGRQKSNKRTLTTDEVDVSEIKEFNVSMPCSVREFSEASGIKTNVIIAKLFMTGIVSNVNSNIEKDAIDLLAAEFEKTVTIKEAKDIEDELEAFHTVEDKEEDLAPRAPIVTVLGHVDHGKTSLLDAIRKTDVTDGEAGGITQHIGSYTVTTESGMDVTFVDTPGHEAFTEMRARGAKITDVAVIVVAADDGVMPQTIEAINHAKAAGVSIVIAMNKMDKDGADPEKVYRELSEQELISEAWGGEVAVIPTVATTGKGIDDLLERLALETEILELQANHFAEASGTVIEAHMSEGRGIAATLLVQRGSLAAGDIVTAGTGFGRVRNMTDWNGNKVEIAGPSHSVEIIGLSDVPTAGDSFHVVTDLKQAAEIADQRQHKKRDLELRERASTTTMASIFDDIASSKMKEFKVLVKADTSGSLEVLKKSLKDISNDEIRINILHAGVGCITTGDVTLAEVSKAVILGFHVIADPKARSSADSKGVDIQSYTIIYELLDTVKAAVTGMLDPEMLEKVIGHAEVRQTFRSSKVGTIAGLYVTDGKIIRDAFMRITRDGVIIHEGKVNTLRRFKEDVKEVRNDYECGLTVEKFHDIKSADIFEFYQREAVARTL